jgi:hypothetical protein
VQSSVVAGILFATAVALGAIGAYRVAKGDAKRLATGEKFIAVNETGSLIFEEKIRQPRT